MERNPKAPGAEVWVRSGDGKRGSTFKRKGGEVPCTVNKAAGLG